MVDEKLAMKIALRYLGGQFKGTLKIEDGLPVGSEGYPYNAERLEGLGLFMFLV